MSITPTRRDFLRTTVAGGAVAGISGLPFLAKLPAVSAKEAKLDPQKVRLDPSIEPLVTLLETTPRNRLLEEVAARIRRGTSYQEVLAALLLAGVRNVQPRPSVGYKFHSVLVVNSAHIASLASPPADRWLPIFWALDYFKRTQIEEEEKSGWKLGPVDERAVPRPSKARRALIDALENWDEPAADAAIAGMARSASAHEVFNILLGYASRDFRSIGHKAIYAANSERTLACIGWHHAEPVLRSLVYAMLNHVGEPNPASSDLDADRPWRRNQGLAEKIRGDYRDGRPSSEAVRELLAVLRTASPDECCDAAVEMLNGGVAPQSIWDAVMVGAGELLMKQPGIVPLHAMTSANAIHFAGTSAGEDRTRRLLLLQNVAFVPLFREAAKGRGKLRSETVDDLQPIEPEHTSRAQAIEEIFGDVSENRMRAAAKVRAFLAAGDNGAKRAGELIDAARRLVFLKGRDAHDYKFSSAALEDYYHVSGEWRDLFLALSVFNLEGSGARDNSLVERTRAALAG